ncbi:MAG: NAD(P)/FAD-dependent oxidoreductase [Luteolibacter sp.]
MQKQLIVIGGGAAGFFCAVNAARLNPALQVLLLEKSGKLLSKVKVSGGGRCNVTHHGLDITEMAKCYPRGQHFVRKAFHRFFVNDTVQWFLERGVHLKAEDDGRMFPVTDSSQTIIDALLHEADRYKVAIQTHAEVKAVRRKTPDPGFFIELSNGAVLTADFVCIACGGYPKASFFDWIKALGHSIEAPVPSLFTFNLPNHPLSKLMGVSLEKVTVRIAGSRLKEEGPLLITHWGLSGPVVLRLSAWGARELEACNWQFTIHVNWIAGSNEAVLREKFQQVRIEWAAQRIYNRNPFRLPQRFWQYQLEQSDISPAMRWADLPAKEQNKLVKNLCDGAFQVKGKTTFKEEFVTAGGVRLDEIAPDTMMSKKVNDLFFAGEIMDVDGITGGYNFQHAWTSGFIAAKAITDRNKL